MKRAFTLIEVNLAMLIMAGGILSVVGLYAFGFRENRHSREDVAATAIADSVMSPLVMAISATNLQWSAFKQRFNYPNDDAWGDYLDRNSGIVKDDPLNKAKSVYRQTMSQINGCIASGDSFSPNFPDEVLSSAGMSCGLVVQHEENSAIVKISFRATRHPGELLAMPLFYTEVRFQGLTDE